MIESCRGLNRIRDRAFLALGCASGFRNSELRSLTRGHLLDETGMMKPLIEVPRQYMKCKKSSRTIPVGRETAKYLAELLDEMETRGMNRSSDPLFANRRTRRVIGAPAAWRLVRRAAIRAGVPAWKVGCHSLRKAAAQRLYPDLLRRHARGERVDPLLETKEFLGHQDVASTLCYLASVAPDSAMRNFETVEQILTGGE